MNTTWTQVQNANRISVIVVLNFTDEAVLRLNECHSAVCVGMKATTKITAESQLQPGEKKTWFTLRFIFLINLLWSFLNSWFTQIQASRRSYKLGRANLGRWKTHTTDEDKTHFQPHFTFAFLFSHTLRLSPALISYPGSDTGWEALSGAGPITAWRRQGGGVWGGQMGSGWCLMHVEEACRGGSAALNLDLFAPNS